MSFNLRFRHLPATTLPVPARQPICPAAANWPSVPQPATRAVFRKHQTQQAGRARYTSLTTAAAAPESAIMSNLRIGFVGAGQMAEAMARGFISKGVAQAGKMCCSDPQPARKELFGTFGVKAYDSNTDVFAHSDVVFLAVKPQQVAAVLSDAKRVLTADKIIVSIAAGITIQAIKDVVGADAKIVRVMPNTPCLVGATAAAMCLGGKAGEEDGEVVKTLFSAVGMIFKVEEKLLSAVTGLSGSGPAYIFMAIEAMADGGVRSGLPRDIAQQLAAQTALGAAKMVLESGRHPGALKDMVTSPAGTTIAGVHELEKAGVRAAFMNAVYAATQRADELSK